MSTPQIIVSHIANVILSIIAYRRFKKHRLDLVIRHHSVEESLQNDSEVEGKKGIFSLVIWPHLHFTHNPLFHRFTHLGIVQYNRSLPEQLSKALDVNVFNANVY